MNLLVTAGNTQVPIDRVRCITNIFSGRTGARIALHALERGHSVTLLTSHPQVVREMLPADPGERLRTFTYRTLDDLQGLMKDHIGTVGPDVVIHSAAVSDYVSAGIYAAAPGTRFDADALRWRGETPALIDRLAGKVKSDEPELWLRLVRAPKLIDLIRAPLGFRGTLVKFKLEVGVSDERLLEIAERSRTHSGADLMVANTLEGAATWAYLGPVGGNYQRIGRRELAERLLDAVEQVRKEKAHG
jgi:phosphopantothenoylcysteine synthetase/decarboxylase